MASNSKMIILTNQSAQQLFIGVEYFFAIIKRMKIKQSHRFAKLTLEVYSIVKERRKND